MRLALALFFVGLIVIAALALERTTRKGKARGDGAPKTGRREAELRAAIDEASAAVAALIESATPRPDLVVALRDLNESLERLASRISGDARFLRRMNRPLRRVLPPVIDVARRTALVLRQPQGEARDARLDWAARVLTRAGRALDSAASRADAVELKALEAELEFLEERLPPE